MCVCEERERGRGREREGEREREREGEREGEGEGERETHHCWSGGKGGLGGPLLIGCSQCAPRKNGSSQECCS